MTALLIGLQLAAAMWGPLPCGQPHVQWSTFPAGDLTLGRAMVGGVASDAPGYEAPPCTILLNLSVFAPDVPITGVNGLVLCTTVIHEEGHLLGLGHSADPTNIMFPAATPPRGCTNAYNAERRAQARARELRRRRRRRVARR